MQPCIHHALLTDDILHAIFQQFQLDQWHPPVPTLSSLRDIDPSQTENERLRCLARSARVCTSFRDAALPVLWGTLYDLVPFLRLFSSCVITHNLTGRVGPRGTHPGPYTFRLDSSYVPQAELQRIMYYGAMVQAVGKHCGYRYQSPQITLYNHRADPASWMHLQGALNGDPKQCLLPNIRRLSVQVFSVPDLDLVSTIASPSLLDLELVDFSHPNDNPSEGWQHVLDERIPVFLAAAPNLERFLLSFRAGPHISNKIASAVSQITSLRILDLRFFSPVSTETDMNPLWIPAPLLAPFRHLKRLALCLHPTFTLTLTSSSTPPSQVFLFKSLPKLRDVEVYHVECTPIYHRLLELLQSCSIRRLALRTILYDNAAGLQDLCRALVRAFPGLSSFSCAIELRYTHARTATTVVAPLRSVMKPLLALRTLQYVDINADSNITSHISLSDDDLDAMSSSWPALRALSLKGFDIFYQVFYNEPRISKLPPQFGISLSAVRTLATNCPHLEQLEIPLLDMQPHRVGPMETYPLLNHQLQRFEVCDMYIGDYSTAACIIDRMFPNVDVMVPLADISELNVEMRPLDWDDTTEMTWAWWKITAQYGLYLGIAMCQDGRSRDPWLRLEH